MWGHPYLLSHDREQNIWAVGAGNPVTSLSGGSGGAFSKRKIIGALGEGTKAVWMQVEQIFSCAPKSGAVEGEHQKKGPQDTGVL